MKKKNCVRYVSLLFEIKVDKPGVKVKVRAISKATMQFFVQEGSALPI